MKEVVLVITSSLQMYRCATRLEGVQQLDRLWNSGNHPDMRGNGLVEQFLSGQSDELTSKELGGVGGLKITVLKGEA